MAPTLNSPPAASGMSARAPANARSTQVGVGELARLVLQLGTARLRQGKDFDLSAAGSAWARSIMQRDNATVLEISALGKQVQIVGDHAYSEDVLSQTPSVTGHGAATPKVEGMSFLAPHALTIAHDEEWKRLRPFNERVLGTGGTHVYAQTFLDKVRGAFSRPVASVEEARGAMGRAMGGIVLGDAAPDPQHVAEDVSTLFGIVQKPVKRKLLGFLYAGRRKRLYELLGRAWDSADAGEPTLIALARHNAPDMDRTALLEQVPHWMFTFPGSGTDLLLRTLVLITSRSAVKQQVIDEARSAGPLDRAETMRKLPYLEACLLEAGRLFPPVTKTFHSHAPTGPDRHIVHYFSLLHRDDRLGPTVHAYRPERWQGPELDAPAAASNLFLRGPRACPGMDLILFVCKAALARLVVEHGVTAPHPRLTSDPLPVSFPRDIPRFTASERSS
ncbi:MAG: hypothetical protein ACT4P7_15280 [Gemmatimonadaceae bacterium]